MHCKHLATQLKSLGCPADIYRLMPVLGSGCSCWLHNNKCKSITTTLPSHGSVVGELAGKLWRPRVPGEHDSLQAIRRSSLHEQLHFRQEHVDKKATRKPLDFCVCNQMRCQIKEKAAAAEEYICVHMLKTNSTCMLPMHAWQASAA